MPQVRCRSQTGSGLAAIASKGSGYGVRCQASLYNNVPNARSNVPITEPAASAAAAKFFGGRAKPGGAPPHSLPYCGGGVGGAERTPRKNTLFF